MRVSINFSVLSDLGQKEEIIESLKRNALEAWKNRPQGTESVKILQEIPTDTGRYFRFYRVTAHNKNQNCLIVRY